MARRQWWQKPKLRTDEDFDKARAVTWLELFFDLIFVVVISSLAHNLAYKVTLESIQVFIFMFIAVFWVWNGSTYYVERFESEGIEIRVFTFLTIITVAGMAIFSHHGMEENYPGFALSYLLARGINMFLWARTWIHVKIFRPTAIRYIIVYLFVAALIVISLFVESELRILLWGSAVLLDVLSPAFTMKHQSNLPKVSTSKFPERFGLLTIIVLGESVIGVINSLSGFKELTFPLALYGILGLIIGFAFWWCYFDFIARRPPKERPWPTLIWVYLHIFLLTFFTMGEVAFSEVLEEVYKNSVKSQPQLLLLFSVGMALIIMGAIELTLKKTGKEPVHPVVSPALKAGTGVVLLLVMWIIPVNSITSVILSIAALTVQIVYGVVKWFSQEVEEEETVLIGDEG